MLLEVQFLVLVLRLEKAPNLFVLQNLVVAGRLASYHMQESCLLLGEYVEGELKSTFVVHFLDLLFVCNDFFAIKPAKRSE